MGLLDETWAAAMEACKPESYNVSMQDYELFPTVAMTTFRMDRQDLPGPE